MRAVLIFLLKGYAILLSPVLHQTAIYPGGCRFYPTCSDYGLRASRQYGLAAGFVLLLKRLVRCHPWSDGGYDPVPDKLKIVK